MLDIEFVDEPAGIPLNIESYYQDLMKAFEWVDNPQGEKKIKQCIDNITISVYQKGQASIQHKKNEQIESLEKTIRELRSKYETKKQDRQYGTGKYQGD
jgi:hypothetical protein